MRRLARTTALLAVTCTTAETAAWACQPSQAAAQVVRIERLRENAVQIRRARAPRWVPATPYDYLCPTDVIRVFQATARAWVTMAGQDRSIELNAGSELPIPEQPAFGPLSWIDTLIRRAATLVLPLHPSAAGRSRRTDGGRIAGSVLGGLAGAMIGREAYSRDRERRVSLDRDRGIDRSSAEDGAAGVRSSQDRRDYERREYRRDNRYDYYDVDSTALAQSDPLGRAGGPWRLLSSEVQFIPRGTPQVSLLWLGPASVLALEDPQSGRAIVSSVEGVNRAEISTASLADRPARLSLHASVGTPLDYQLVPVDPVMIPSPPELAGKSSLSPQERLGRALWLLDDSKPAWHLFAVTELHELSSRFIVADQTIRRLSGLSVE